MKQNPTFHKILASLPFPPFLASLPRLPSSSYSRLHGALRLLDPLTRTVLLISLKMQSTFLACFLPPWLPLIVQPQPNLLARRYHDTTLCRVVCGALIIPVSIVILCAQYLYALFAETHSTKAINISWMGVGFGAASAGSLKPEFETATDPYRLTSLRTLAESSLANAT